MEFSFEEAQQVLKTTGLPEQIIAGVLLAFICVGIQHLVFSTKPILFWSMGLAVAAILYNGFVALAPFEDTEETVQWHGIEAVGVVAYGVLALMGVVYSGVWTAVGWALHPAWDVYHMLTPEAVHVPEWYPGFCIGFDVIIALWVLGHSLLGEKLKAS